MTFDDLVHETVCLFVFNRVLKESVVVTDFPGSLVQLPIFPPAKDDGALIVYLPAFSFWLIGSSVPLTFVLDSR